MFKQQNAGFNGINREFIWDLCGMFRSPFGKHTKSELENGHRNSEFPMSMVIFHCFCMFTRGYMFVPCSLHVPDVAWVRDLSRSWKFGSARCLEKRVLHDPASPARGQPNVGTSYLNWLDGSILSCHYPIVLGCIGVDLGVWWCAFSWSGPDDYTYIYYLYNIYIYIYIYALIYWNHQA